MVATKHVEQVTEGSMRVPEVHRLPRDRACMFYVMYVVCEPRMGVHGLSMGVSVIGTGTLTLSMIRTRVRTHAVPVRCTARGYLYQYM